MPTDAGLAHRPEIIHAFHGVTPTGNWFLLADVAPDQSAGYRQDAAAEPALDTTWLVILGRRDRDIITMRGESG